jgi:hypothetical protein
MAFCMILRAGSSLLLGMIGLGNTGIKFLGSFGCSCFFSALVRTAFRGRAGACAFFDGICFALDGALTFFRIGTFFRTGAFFRTGLAFTFAFTGALDVAFFATGLALTLAFFAAGFFFAAAFGLDLTAGFLDLTAGFFLLSAFAFFFAAFFHNQYSF